MEACKKLSVSILDGFGQPKEQIVRQLFEEEYCTFHRKVAVLDDDPTGVQTVHNVSVYTDWGRDAVREAMEAEDQEFFILTNSRGFQADQTAKAHEEIGKRLSEEALAAGRELLVISRGDSTLRGHFWLEPQVLKNALETGLGYQLHGLVLCPFFLEGGRYTIDSVHYVKEGKWLVPAAQTEFAKDNTFGYSHSHLGEYIEEKSGGRVKKEDCIRITLPELRAMDADKITAKLMAAHDFQPVLVDAIAETDVLVFAVSLMRAMKQGKEFLIRSAAAMAKVMGNVHSRPLLSREELIKEGDLSGGIVLAGSHVKKTTEQLEELRSTSAAVRFLEFDVNSCFAEGGLTKEADRVRAEAERLIRSGVTAVVYTSRRVMEPEGASREELLKISVDISEAVTGIIGSLREKPRFIIAKGGITSSDVGTKALGVKKALVLGQVQPGVPVWKTGPESRFPGMAYIIFPGNVGEKDTLRKIVDMLGAADTSREKLREHSEGRYDA